MKLKDVVARIENFLPLSWCEEWDNSGLLVGDIDADVQRVAVALDASPLCVEAAIDYDLLITHHPVIFKPIKRLVNDNPSSRAIIAATRNRTALYAAHTNWDVAPGGVNGVLAKVLGLVDVKPLVPSAVGAWGLGAVGKFDKKINIADLAEMLRERWQLSWLLVHAEDDMQVIERVALMGGSGGSYWQTARDNADIYITADAGYHNILDALSDAFPMVTVGHGEMERNSLPALAIAVGGVLGMHVDVL